MADSARWTDEQRQAIFSRGQNLLVSASAGSGKTAVLVERIFQEVFDPAGQTDIDRMLIVTFTNASSSQLRERIRQRIEERLKDDPEDAHAIRQLILLSKDHIETIDRFCREVVLDHYDKTLLDPSFRIGDEGELKLLRAEALSQAIEEAYACDDLQKRKDFIDFSECYAPGTDDSALEDLILRFYEFSESHEFPSLWRRNCAEHYREEADGSEWMKSMLEYIRMQGRDLHLMLREAIEVSSLPDGPSAYLPNLIIEEGWLKSMGEGSSVQAIRNVMESVSWKRMPQVRSSSGVDPSKKKFVSSIRDDVKKAYKKLQSRFFAQSESDVEENQKNTFRYMKALSDVTDRFDSIFSQMKTERNIADFSDVSHNALRVLIKTDIDGNPLLDGGGNYVITPEAREYASYFEEVLIDEYQDSNRIQEVLLKSVSKEELAEGTYAGAHQFNRFMVGDVKQSIYRFRMADPLIFSKKAAIYSRDAESTERRIDLHHNFRSRECVIDVVNLIFRQIMRREIGGIEYDTSEELKPSCVFPEYPDGERKEDERDIQPELILIEKDDVPSADGKIRAEAEAVAERISQIAGKMKIFDRGRNEYRTAKYGDIVILLRTARGWTDAFSKALSSRGIPTNIGKGTGYFDAVEIKTILSYLSVLDNPRQDIPLAASLRSSIGGLTDSELSEVRRISKEGSLYCCLRRYIENGEDELIRNKLSSFSDMTETFRARVCDTPVHQLLWEIFDKTGYALLETQSEGGKQRKANLDLLIDKAIAYERTSYRGLFQFIRYIEKLRKGDIDFAPASPTFTREDAVRIMTMHASKGLEFPVVFVSGLNKRFNTQDTRSPLVLHNILGAGLDYVDSNLRLRRPNRIRRAIAGRVEVDSAGEELRVLYVAMTRAMEKLVLTGCVDNRKKYLESISSIRSCKMEKFPGTTILSSKSALDWVVSCLMRHEAERTFFDDDRWELPTIANSPVRDLRGRVILRTGEEVLSSDRVEEHVRKGRVLRLSDIEPEMVYDSNLMARLQEMLSWTYRYPGHEDIPGKLSVSELKRMTYETEMRRRESRADEGDIKFEQAPFLTMLPYNPSREGDGRVEAGGGTLSPGEAIGIMPVALPNSAAVSPRFLSDGLDSQVLRGKCSRGRGTAYHEVLAALDFSEEPYPGQVRGLLEMMVKCGKIPKEDALGIHLDRVEHFLQTDLARRMREASRRGELRREQPFVLGIGADKIRSEWDTDETVLIQGIIDAYFLENGCVILVDYKSDYVKEGDEKSLVARYRTQFWLYSYALKSLLRRKVPEAYVYSLTLGKAIPVNFDESVFNRGLQTILE